jgi:hypothetical protein
MWIGEAVLKYGAALPPLLGAFLVAIALYFLFHIFLNGRPVTAKPDGFFADECIETIPLPAPRRGSNLLTLATGFRPEHEIEDVFLIGDFAAASTRKREIIAERVRDKIAAAKKKGKRCGGMPVLGYDLVGGKLVVNLKGHLAS